MAAAGLRYDVIVDVYSVLLRVQVKSTQKAVITSLRKKPTYFFNIATGKQKKIKKGEVDIVAFVAVDIGVIAYFLADSCVGKRSIQLKPPGTPISSDSKRDETVAEFPFCKVVKQLFG